MQGIINQPIKTKKQSKYDLPGQLWVGLEEDNYLGKKGSWEKRDTVNKKAHLEN